MKSIDCIDVLILYNADPSLSIKLQEKDGERSLDINALEYAIGEKKKAVGKDKDLYQDIIDILKAKMETVQPLSASDSNVGAPLPSQVVDEHRLFQKIFQNDLAIKKLTHENEQLKKELQSLRHDIERFKPWIERWIYESVPTTNLPTPTLGIPAATQPQKSLDPITENDQNQSSTSRKSTRKKRTTDIEPESSNVGKKMNSPSSRPKSVMVANTRTKSESDRPVTKVKRVQKKTANNQTVEPLPIEKSEKKEDNIKTPKRTPKKKPKE